MHRKTAHTLVFEQPASRWQDALPVGNGTVGALVYGAIRNETIILNHEDLWFRTPKPHLPDVADVLPEVRELLAAGNYREAARRLPDAAAERGFSNRIDPYHPAFDLKLEMQTEAAFTAYRRTLHMDTGEASVCWTENRRRCKRQLLASRADDVVVLRVASPDGPVSLNVWLTPHNLAEINMGAGTPGTTDRPPFDFAATADTPWLTMTATYADGNQFGGVARVAVRGGTTELAGGEALRVRGADEVLVLLKLFANEAAAPALARLRKELAALPAKWTTLRRRHVNMHQQLFRRMTFSLDRSPAKSVDQLLRKAYANDVADALIEKMTLFGRHLLISSSRPGGLPANLQGVWNGDYQPAWSSDYHNDENIQMNYWQALPGNLAEIALPFFDYYESMLDDNRRNAEALFGCRGIAVPIAQSTHGIIHGGHWMYWTAGAGWLAQLFYDYWLFTGDDGFLRDRAIPYLREVALFYQDFLVEDANGKLMVSPSLSPENCPDIPDSSMVVVNASMDIAIAREVLSNLCAACRHLGIADPELPRWQEMLEKLPPYEVNADGALREWLAPGLKDNYHHRHQSHLYPLFPGFEISREETPELFAAARTAVEKRLVIGLTSQTGWSLAHMANIYARLGEGDRALECLELILRFCTGPNLFTWHNDWRGQGVTMHWPGAPFQIDANFGFTAAVQEMLVQSRPDWIGLLPALPKRWQRGELTGMMTRCGVEVDMTWECGGAVYNAALRATREANISVSLPDGQTQRLRLPGGERIELQNA
jgi:alpha-L-fucosidase 2